MLLRVNILDNSACRLEDELFVGIRQVAPFPVEPGKVQCGTKTS